MASLPSGWTADYDGQRWFFTYGPTGQSQFQFPRPGDEFPDLLPCCAFGFGAGDAVLTEVEILPEQRVESERQARRARAPSFGGGCTGDVVDEEDGGDVADPVCFENFAAVRFRGRHGPGGDHEEVTRILGQSGFCEGDRALLPGHVGTADDFGESTGKQTGGRESVSLVINEEHSKADSFSRQEAETAAAISITSEPVLAAVETEPTASVGCEHRLATVARPSPPKRPMPDGPMPDGRAVKPAHSPPWAISVGVIPELHSESTALCEEEINPPPVELPCNEGGRHGQSVVPSTAFQNIYELPAQERRRTSLKKDERTGRLEPRCISGNYALTSQAGATEAPGAKSYSHDRGGLPSQASRMRSEESSRETKQPAGTAGPEGRDLTHFPSVLRPGPRRSDQRRPPAPVTAAPITNAPHMGHDLPHQPQEHRFEEQPARMPAMPPPHHAYELQQTAAQTTSPEPPPQLGDARQDRLPGSVNFVIPVRHLSGGPPHSEPCNITVEGSPEYRVSATFASAASSKGASSVAGGQTSGGRLGLATGRKAESWGWPADEAGRAQLGAGSSAPGLVPKWSWGWAR